MAISDNQQQFMALLLSGMVGMFGVVVTIVVSALKIQNHISSKFEQHRKLMYRMFSRRDRAIRRLEFQVFRMDAGFQPGVDPIQLAMHPDNGADEGENGGNDQ